MLEACWKDACNRYSDTEYLSDVAHPLEISKPNCNDPNTDGPGLDPGIGVDALELEISKKSRGLPRGKAQCKGAKTQRLWASSQGVLKNMSKTPRFSAADPPRGVCRCMLCTTALAVTSAFERAVCAQTLHAVLRSERVALCWGWAGMLVNNCPQACEDSLQIAP